jgi:hypothetical protein
MGLVLAAVLAQETDRRLEPAATLELSIRASVQFIEQRAKAQEWLDAGPAFPGPFIRSCNGRDPVGTLENLPEISLRLGIEGWGLEAGYADMRQRFPGTLDRDTNYDLHLFPAGRYEFDYLIRRYRAGLLAPPFRWDCGGRELELRLGAGAEVQRIEFGLHGPPPHEQVQGNTAIVPYLLVECRTALFAGFEAALSLRGGLQPWQTSWPEEGAHGFFLELELRGSIGLAGPLFLEFGPRFFAAEFDFDGVEDPISRGDNERQIRLMAFFAGVTLRF